MNAHSPAFHEVNSATTPGAYMRACRRAASMSIERCAQAIGDTSVARVHAREQLERMEAETPGDYGRLVQVIRDRRVFTFDFSIFVSLCAATTRAEAQADDWLAGNGDWEE